MILIESKYDFDWIKIWFWLNQNMILIKSKYDFDWIKYDFDWIKIWFWLNQNMILIESKYDFDWILIWFWWSQNMIFIESKYDFDGVKIWFFDSRLNIIFIGSKYDFFNWVESKYYYIIYFHSNYWSIFIVVKSNEVNFTKRYIKGECLTNANRTFWNPLENSLIEVKWSEVVAVGQNLPARLAYNFWMF